MFTLSRRRVVVLVVLTCLLLITLDQRGNAIIDRVRGVVSLVVRPFDAAVRAITLPVARAWNGIVNYDEVERENEALRDQLERLKGAEIESRSAILEYRELLRLNNLTSKFIYDTAVAQVVGESPSNFQNVVEINIGSSRGVEVGMPVIDGAGLIGRITKVFPDRSIVLLITDAEYAISAQVLSTVQDVPLDPGSGGDETEVTTPSGIPVEDLPAYATTTTTLPGGITLPSPPTTASTTTTSSTTTTTGVEVVRETGTLEGRGANSPLVLRFVDVESALSNIKVGSVVDTAGGATSIAPQGIPIGFISRILEQVGSSTVLVEVTPSATLRRLNFVAVVLYTPNRDAVRF